LEKIRHRYALDRPLVEQYGLYISRLVQGDLGRSMDSRRPVLTDLKEYFPATLELVAAAMSLAILGGVSVGITTAVKRGGFLDHTSRLFSVAGLSMPVFWLAILVQFVVYYQLGWLPFGERVSTDLPPFPHPTGIYTIDAILAGRPDALWNVLTHLIMPALVLSLEPLAVLARLTRASMLEVMAHTYIQTARAKGLREWTIVANHALKNGLLPVITMIGMQIGWALGGSILVEVIFNWPGIGRYAAASILSADHNAVMAITLLIGMVYLLANATVDILYVKLDPRIRY
jgi:peptide/nickel transport system permease protein